MQHFRSKDFWDCKRFEPWGHSISRLSIIVQVNKVLNRTVVVGSDLTF